MAILVKQYNQGGVYYLSMVSDDGFKKIVPVVIINKNPETEVLLCPLVLGHKTNFVINIGKDEYFPDFIHMFSMKSSALLSYLGSLSEDDMHNFKKLCIDQILGGYEESVKIVFKNTDTATAITNEAKKEEIKEEKEEEKKETKIPKRGNCLYITNAPFMSVNNRHFYRDLFIRLVKGIIPISTNIRKEDFIKYINADLLMVLRNYYGTKLDDSVYVCLAPLTTYEEFKIMYPNINSENELKDLKSCIKYHYYRLTLSKHTGSNRIKISYLSNRYRYRSAFEEKIKEYAPIVKKYNINSLEEAVGAIKETAIEFPNKEQLGNKLSKVVQANFYSL